MSFLPARGQPEDGSEFTKKPVHGKSPRFHQKIWSQRAALPLTAARLHETLPTTKSNTLGVGESYGKDKRTPFVCAE